MTDETLDNETADGPAGQESAPTAKVDFAATMAAKMAEDNELLELRKAFKPEDGSKIEFNIHENGLSVVANREGWQTLGKVCDLMAHPMLPDYAEPYELTGDILPDEMFKEGRAILAFWGIEETPDAAFQDVHFHRSPVIGDEYWNGGLKSGNSPRTKVVAFQTLDRFRWLDGRTRQLVEEDFGTPIFEREAEKDGKLTCYKCDTPEGWITVEYDVQGNVTAFGISTPEPWTEEIDPAFPIIVEFKGL